MRSSKNIMIFLFILNIYFLFLAVVSFCVLVASFMFDPNKRQTTEHVLVIRKRSFLITLIFLSLGFLFHFSLGFLFHFIENRYMSKPEDTEIVFVTGKYYNNDIPKLASVYLGEKLYCSDVAGIVNKFETPDKIKVFQNKCLNAKLFYQMVWTSVFETEIVPVDMDNYQINAKGYDKPMFLIQKGGREICRFLDFSDSREEHIKRGSFFFGTDTSMETAYEDMAECRAVITYVTEGR